MINERVIDYTTPNGDWNWEKLGEVLPLDCLETIMPIKAPVVDCMRVFGRSKPLNNSNNFYGLP